MRLRLPERNSIFSHKVIFNAKPCGCPAISANHPWSSVKQIPKISHWIWLTKLYSILNIALTILNTLRWSHGNFDVYKKKWITELNKRGPATFKIMAHYMGTGALADL